jgi:glutamate racemase
MKAKIEFSQLVDDRNYLNKVLIVFAVFACGTATAVAWPAIMFQVHKFF